MKTKPMLTLDDARTMVAAGEAEAKRNGWNVVIAVCDDGGHLVLLHRLDGVAPISSAIAPAKARAAALGKRESKVYEDMINQGRNAFLSAPLDGMLEGGVPIAVDGHVVGAVGVSGVKSSEDAQIAKAAIAALKL
jgi:glc operon protein GlcG